jgi:hypothetical protein
LKTEIVSDGYLDLSHWGTTAAWGHSICTLDSAPPIPQSASPAVLFGGSGTQTADNLASCGGMVPRGTTDTTPLSSQLMARIHDNPLAPAPDPAMGPWSPPAVPPVDGMIDTTPRLGDPVHVVTPARSFDRMFDGPQGPADPQPNQDAEGPQDTQLATPVRQLEGTRARGQAFDTAMRPQGPRASLPAADASLDVQTLPEPIRQADLVVSAADALPAGPARSDAANRPQGTQADGQLANRPGAASNSTAAQAASQLANASPELAIGQAVNNTDIAGPPGSAAVNEANASAARNAVVAAVMAVPDADTPTPVASLDGDWTKNTVALAAAALAGRQLMGGPPASGPLAAPRLARWKLPRRKGAGIGA